MTLLGRAAEQEQVSRLLASARLGQGGALTLVGEAGAGKTALLTEVVTGMDHARLLWATGTEIEQDLPFAALHAVLRPTLHLLDELPAPQADALGGALSLRHAGPLDRFATGAATLSLLSRAAEDAPVLVVLDDAHWADQPSVEALAFAARRLQEDPLAILFSARSGEVPDALSTVPTLELGGLDAVSTAELLRHVHRGAPDPATLQRLLRLTGGNPLALIELGRDPAPAIVAPGSDEPGLLQQLPERLRSAFERRLDRLSRPQRAMALVAAVCGGDLRLTRAVGLRLDLDADDLDRVAATGLLSLDRGRLVFRHPLLRSVAYRTAPEDLRRAAHLAVAEELVTEDQRDLQVWHRAAAATMLDEDLAADLEAVGARAAARSALTVASTAFERAARWSPEASAAGRRLVAAAQFAWDGGLRDRALSLLSETEYAGTPVTAATVQLRGVIAMRSGSVREGLDRFEAAADLAATADERVHVLAQAVHACLYLADARSLDRVAERLDGTLADLTSPTARAVGLAALGVARVLLGEDGTPHLREAVPQLSAHVDPVVQTAAFPWLLLAPLFLRETDAGAELRELVDAVRTRVGVGVLPNVLVHVARDQATSTAYERAAANFDEAARLARETGQGTELAMALAGRACLEARTGQVDECREHAAEASELARTRDIHFAEIWCELALGDLALSAGAPDDAAQRLVALVARLGELGVGDPDLDPGPELVDALLRIGEPGEAAQAAWRFAALAGPAARPWTRARVERALGLVATDGDWESHFRAALGHHDRTRDVFESARTRLAYGMRLRRTGQRVEARARLREALTTFEDLRARLWADTTRTELEATGERVPRREPAGPGALTPQELQVCLLLAEGKTTREAAAALFLSPKTIEYHLRKAYTKLGIHSREELSATLRSIG